jgi:hypothetical protein
MQTKYTVVLSLAAGFALGAAQWSRCFCSRRRRVHSVIAGQWKTVDKDACWQAHDAALAIELGIIHDLDPVVVHDALPRPF